MKLRLIFALTLTLAPNSFSALRPEYEQLKADAEKFFADASFSKAHELYEQAAKKILPDSESHWVQFRLADTQWRSQFATEQSDTTKIDQARSGLEKLVRDVAREDEHGRVWVEVQESLADYWWTRRHNNNWGQAWPYYQRALDWWAGAADIELARERYLKIVWRMAKPPQVERYYYYGYWGNMIPLDVLENALKIAKSDEDKAHAHFLLAMTLRQQAGDPETRQRVVDEFDAAIKLGKKTDWFDDALYNHGDWLQSQGRIIYQKNGNYTVEPDYVKALEIFRRLVKEFRKGESRHWENAQQQIKNITDPQVGVSAGNIFLPDSEIQYYLSWRNVKKIELALYPVDLNRDVKLGKGQQNWLQSITLGEKIKSWTREPKKSGRAELLLGPEVRDAQQRVPTKDGAEQNDYKPGNETVRIDKLKPGAYVIEAKAGGKEARDLILVSDGALVLKTSGKQALAFFANALDSSPLGDAKVKLWEWWHENNSWHVREQSKNADKDGIAVFDLTHPASHSSLQLFASAIRNDRQAFSTGNSYWYHRQDEPWKIYAFTDRPAYRPKETVNWKFIARRYNGSVYSTPSDQTIEFEITDPRGTKINSDKAKLNTFGSAWGSVELTEQMPLGEYRVQFWDDGRKNGIGSATLFRLEEYKLPEFKVSVKMPDEDAPNGTKQRKSYKLGDKVEVEIQADYYFGGPVANATVEVLVHQSPFFHSWHEPRDFPWFYEDMDSNSPYSGRWNRGYGGDQIIKRETIKTDATGKAKLTFDTPKGGGQDLEFRVEARVTDSSRREITGNGSVRVTRQRYYVYANADHNLYRPQDKVHVNFKALDANEQSVQTEGNVKITRDYWWEIWISPAGKEVKGDELRLLRDKSSIWPPRPTKPNEPGWRLKFRGYQHDDILTKTLKTDTNGVAEIEFKPERDGYYRVSWTSEDKIAKSRSQIANPIKAETTVWVASGATTELGYRHGGVEIIADKDTFRVGSKAPVMLVVPTNDRYVLFTVEGEELYSYQLVHVTGTVKLIELPIEEKHVPNIFLGATLLSDRQMFADTKQIIVPPTKNFLTVDVKPDREQHQPREEGSFTITTKNDAGKPVAAELAFGLVDESVFYIQQDYAGDPRQFYFGTKREQQIQTQATMNHKSYAKLVEGENEQLMDERDLGGQKVQRARQAGTEWYYDYADKDFNGRSDDLGVLADREESLSRAKSGNVYRANIVGYVNAAQPASAAAEAPARMMKSVGAIGGRFEGKADGFNLGVVPMTPPGHEPAVVVRSDFRSTVFWQPDIVTDKNGKATVKVKYPDSLTSWKATARAVTAANQFGIADTTTRTKMPLIVRLQAPRFFVVGDTVTISAVVNNNTEHDVIVYPKIEVEGLEVKVDLGGRNPNSLYRAAYSTNLPTNGEARFDCLVEVKQPGKVKLKAEVRNDKFSLADAMEKTFIAYEHGIEKFISKSGKARGNDITVKLDLPKERKADSTSLTVQVTPSMAVTMLDALPYLIDYPYGCTEQTMSRFLPAAITAKTLRDLGLQPEDVMGRIFGGIETNTAAATHPKGKKHLAELDTITKASLERLYDFQHGDGGWGWWKQGDSDHWMTAYVVWGLSLARDAKIKIKEDVLSRGKDFLSKTLVEEEENHDMQAFMLHALAVYYAPYKDQLTSKSVPKAFDNLWKNREKLNAYTRALLALSAHYFGKPNEAKTLIENLENGVKRDERPDQSVLIKPDTSHSAPDTVLGTAHWGEDGIYWRWSDGGVEATAFALRALLAIDPKNKLIEPVSNWLIKNRRGAQWSNTRDTAIVVLAMNDYLRVSGELKTDIEYELIVNGSSIAKKKIRGAEVFNAPSRFTIDPKLIKDANEIQIKRKGDGSVYFAVEGKFFSLEEPITPAGNEIFVKREYYKLVGRPTLLKGFVYDKQPLRDGETVKSGERVETLLTIEAKNNYEYLVFEDLKPSGLEAVEVRSGQSLYANELKSGAVDRKFAATNATPVSPKSKIQSPKSANKRAVIPRPKPVEDTDYTGRTRWVYQELRDRKVALFLDKLPEGVWEIRYDLRAEVPGRFHALPVVGHAMYVPEIRCNGAEVRINVVDAKP